MAILDFKEAIQLGKRCSGTVLLNEVPTTRATRNNGRFMSGQFLNSEGQIDFRIWDESMIEMVQRNGSGLYHIQSEGASYNDQTYINVKAIAPETDPQYEREQFLPAIDEKRVLAIRDTAYAQLRKLGATERCFELLEDLLAAPDVDARFLKEGAAVRHHDNLVHGLAHHSYKMLYLAVTMMQLYPFMREHVDLFTIGIVLHDVGKIYEYDHLSMGEFWYANHRVRGIEFLAGQKDRIIAAYDEAFYRQLQAIIQGHHGQYEDRPCTVATLIVHWIDSLEAQMTGLEAQLAKLGNEKQLRWPDFGFLYTFD
ncbi:MAG: HD domain-containing protein [Eubacteriales bacterium]|nr:HD domain-containing protein [Eubacteriales bacterium]